MRRLRVEPVNHNGKLVIRVALSERSSKDLGELKGRVLDDEGHAIEGAQVTLETSWGEGGWGGGEQVSNEPRHRSSTDEQGRYQLPGVPRWTIDDRPLKVRVRVTRDGYAGRETPLLTFGPGEQKTARVLDAIQLERGVSLCGVVVDHRGRPVAGSTDCESNQRSLHPTAAFRGSSSSEALTDSRRAIHPQESPARSCTNSNVNSMEKLRKANSYLVDGSPDRSPHSASGASSRAESRGRGRSRSRASPRGGRPARGRRLGHWSEEWICQLADV